MQIDRGGHLSSVGTLRNRSSIPVTEKATSLGGVAICTAGTIETTEKVKAWTPSDCAKSHVKNDIVADARSQSDHGDVMKFWYLS